MNLNDSFNGFDICVDWLEFTLHNVDIVQACSLVGLNFFDFEVQNNGALGYSKYAKHTCSSIAIMWEGSDSMGCHFRVTGSAIIYFFESFIYSRMNDTPFGSSAIEVDDFTNHYFSLLFDVIRQYGKVTRLDLALDDYTGKYYNTDSILDNLNNCKVVSKFKTYECIFKRKLSDNSSMGHTIYFGSRTSDIMLRVYDKKIQKNSDVEFWNRWEFELKNNKANDVVDIIIKNNCVGQLFFEILNSQLRFIELDDCNRSRCSMQQLWSEFLNGVAKCNLSIHKSVKTAFSKLQWLESQCFPTLSGLLKYNDGDMSFFYDVAEKSFERNSPSSKRLFNKEVEYVLQ